MCRKLETERSGWMNTFLHRHGMAGSKREEVLLDWNELAEKYGKLPFNTIYGCIVSYLEFDSET